MLRFRRFLLLLTVTALGGLAGCMQAYVSTDPQNAARLGFLADLAGGADKPMSEADPAAEGPAAIAPISTVATPDRPRRPISLGECISLALENGRTGEFYDRIGTDRQTSVSGLQRLAPPSGSSDNVRVFALDAAIASTDIDQSLARFDALWRTTSYWNHIDALPGLNAGNTPLVGVLDSGLTDTAEVRSELLQPWPTGGVAGVTLRADYARAVVPVGSLIPNPFYQPALEFTFEQPLLQGAGVLINQVRDTFPTAVQQPVPSQAVPPGATPGILVARIGRDEARLEFERRMQEVLFAVEQAYWDLYSAYWDLYTRDTGLRQAQLAWQVAKQRFDKGGISEDDVAQIEETYHFFRTQRLESLGRGTAGRPGVLEAERRLRYVIGLPAEDGNRLVPTDTPATAPVQPNWEEAVRLAAEKRPELLQVHKEIEVTHLAMLRAKDYLLPDLRFYAKYGVNGLEGSLPGDSHYSTGPFSTGETGIQLEVPIGFRAANAELTRVKLQLAQRYAFLRDQESKLLFSLQRSYRDVIQFREEMVTRRSLREAAAVQLRARYARFKAKGEVTSDLLVRTQRDWADALRDEYVAICKYNVALADLERQKGTICEYCNVQLVDGEVPSFAKTNASQHLRTLCRDQVTSRLPAPEPPGEPADLLTSPDRLNAQANQILTYVDP
jgi:outer membrane protein TolC